MAEEGTAPMRGGTATSEAAPGEGAGVEAPAGGGGEAAARREAAAPPSSKRSARSGLEMERALESAVSRAADAAAAAEAAAGGAVVAGVEDVGGTTNVLVAATTRNFLLAKVSESSLPRGTY